MAVKRRMLVALAHPDDESFGMAGTIAYYAQQGVEITLICATNGDVGSADEKFLQKYKSMSELRLNELNCAAQKLGFANVITFGYRDSGMAGSPDNDHPGSLFQASLDDVAQRVTQVIREARPQVVITFDPYGGYGHPDHIKIHQATIEAFEAAGDPAQYPEQIENGLLPYHPQKLYFLTRDRSMLRWQVRLMPLFGTNPAKVGRNKDINLYEIAQHQYPIHTRINTRTVADIADEARRCHASQLSGGGQGFSLFNLLTRVFYDNTDTFSRSYPPVNNKHVRETDLFEGVQFDEDEINE